MTEADDRQQISYSKNSSHWFDAVAEISVTEQFQRLTKPKPTTPVAQRLLMVIYEATHPLTKAEWLDAAEVHDRGSSRFRSSTGHEAINNFVRNGAVARLSNGTFRRAA